MNRQKNKIVILGGGGHAKVLIELIRQAAQYEIAGILDLKLPVGEEVTGVPVLGKDKSLPELYEQGVRNICLGVGSVNVDSTRQQLFHKVKEIGFSLPCLVHPTAIIASDVSLSEGAQIMAGVVVQPGSIIRENTIINTAAVVDHDCNIGRHVHVCPGVVISGGSIVEDNSFIGAGAVIIHRMKIGKNVLVGAGAVVVRDIPDHSVVKGVPAK